MSHLVGYDVAGDVVRLRCAVKGTGDKHLLVLGFPRPQVVRIHATGQGDFAENGAPGHPIRTVEGAGRTVRFLPGQVAGAAVSVVVAREPFALTVVGPTGERLLKTAEIAFEAGAGADTPPEGWRVRFPAVDGEAFYGFGERFNAVNQRGQTVQIWGIDAGMGSFLGIRATAYKNSPFFLSSRRYAVFWDSSYRLDCDMGASSKDEVAIVADGPIFDLYVS